MKRSIFATSILALTALAACDTTSPEPDTEVSSASSVDRQRAWSHVDASPPGALGPVASPALTEPSAELDPGPVAELSPTVEEEVEIAPTPVQGVEIEIRHGESLYTLASHSGLTVEQIAEANGLDVTRPLQPGQSLVIPVEAEHSASLADAREVAADGRLERYVGRRGGLVGTSAYQVQTGDTAWGVAKQQAGVPMWVLSAYNEGVDLDRLRIGDELIVPVLADTVAQLEEPESEEAQRERSSGEVEGALAEPPSVEPEGALGSL